MLGGQVVGIKKQRNLTLAPSIQYIYALIILPTILLVISSSLFCSLPYLWLHALMNCLHWAQSMELWRMPVAALLTTKLQNCLLSDLEVPNC